MRLSNGISWLAYEVATLEDFLIREFRRGICKTFGHKWERLTGEGFFGDDVRWIECRRCGFIPESKSKRRLEAKKGGAV